MLRKIRKVIDTIDMCFFMTCLIVLVALTVFAVFMRYVASKPISWTEEIQMILLVWSVFSGASIAFRARGHIAIDLLTNALPKAVQKIVGVAVWIVVLITVCWIFKLELSRTLQLWTTNQVTPMLRIPKYIDYGVIVGCCFMMIVNHLLNGIESIVGKGEE